MFSKFRLKHLLIFCLILTGTAGSRLLAEPGKNQFFGDSRAVKGGQLTLHTSEFPKSFNAYVNNAADASAVFELVYAGLMELDPNTLEYQPQIAKSWEVSPDKKEFLIKLNPEARWSDGKEITTADVKFTYDVIMNPKNMTSVIRLYIGRLNPPEIIDKYTVKFTAKTVHYKNLELLAGLNILPKHLMEGKNFNKDFNMTLPGGSGPYNLTEVKEGRYYVLTRKKNYWADRLPRRRGTYNFSKIKYKVMNANMAFEAFKKGEFDIYDEITAKRWVTETGSAPFKRNWIVKQKIYNYAPRGFQGLALNMRRPFLKDLRVRQALGLLLDRGVILDKIMFKQYQPLTSYFPTLYGLGEKSNPLIGYNPGKAKNLLREAGFNRLGKDGYLENPKGAKAEFTISYVNEDNEKYLTLYTESCKQAGVKVNLERLSWATLIKKMDEYNFDAVTIAWTGVLFTDPEQLWHSKHAGETGGSNLAGYQNPEVDRLIDSLPAIFDINQRNKIIKKIDGIIYQEAPYVLFWEANYAKIFYRNIFGKPRAIFPKYSTDLVKYWWFDPVKAKKYQAAVKQKKALPAEPEEIFYDKLAGK